MNAREKIIETRKQKKLTIKRVSEKTGISQTLLGMVEAGHVTHPKIAKKIGKYYGLTELETEELMPKCRRPHDPEYDPSLEEPKQYEPEGPLKRNDKDLIYTYIAERQHQSVKQHAKRGNY